MDERGSRQIHESWANIEKDGLSEENLGNLFRNAHDIKGQAHTMGYPIAGTIAGSLCNMIENVQDRDKLPITILKKHVQAILAVVNEDAREEDNAVGKALAEQLVSIANDIVEDVGEIQE